MKLSVIVPVYNVEKYLEECINSIFIQEIEGIEIIIINDGSTDNSLKILKKIKKDNKSENIVLINQKNMGLSYARNEGLKVSKGKYIYFLDSDDFLFKGALKKLLEVGIKENSDITIGEYTEYYSEEEKNDKKISKELKLTGREYLIEKIKEKKLITMVWNKIYKKELIIEKKLTFFEGIYYEDDEFNFRSMYLASKVVEKKIMLYNYRQRKGSIMNNSMEKNKIKYIESSYKIGNSISNFLLNKNEKNIYLRKAAMSYYFRVFSLINAKDLSLDKVDYIFKKIKSDKDLILKLPTNFKEKLKLIEILLWPKFYHKKRYFIRRLKKIFYKRTEK